jgi:hypothetical protein
MPKPTATGTLVCARARATTPSMSSAPRSPVVPVTDTV